MSKENNQTQIIQLEELKKINILKNRVAKNYKQKKEFVRSLFKFISKTSTIFPTLEINKYTDTLKFTKRHLNINFQIKSFKIVRNQQHLILYINDKIDDKLYIPRLDIYFKRFKFDSEPIMSLEDFFIHSYKYHVLGAFTLSLAVQPKFIEDLNIDVELFGSMFNTIKPFCSLFENEINLNLHKTLGNFFDYELEEKIYLANPPFDEDIMERMSTRLINQLEKTKAIVYVVLPVWDIKTRLLLNLKPEGEFKAYHILINSQFLKKQKVFTNMKFRDYYNYVDINPTPIHLIKLSSK